MSTQILTEAQGPECFWVNNGPIVKDLAELKEAIRNMSKEKFNYHAGGDNNDFIDWIEFVLKESKLAKKLKRYKTRRGYVNTISKYIS